MANAHRGMTNRALAKSLERFHMRLLRLGYSEQEATRGATALTAFKAKCNREQAWEAADEIAAWIPQTGETP